MKDIKIKLVDILYPVQVVVSGFPKPIFLLLKAKDYMVTYAKAFYNLFVKTISVGIEKSSSSAFLKIIPSLMHKDYEASNPLNPQMTLFLKSNTRDANRALVQNDYKLYLSSQHSDVNISTANARLITPIKIKDLAKMTIREMANREIIELVREDI